MDNLHKRSTLVNQLQAEVTCQKRRINEEHTVQEKVLIKNNNSKFKNMKSGNQDKGKLNRKLSPSRITITHISPKISDVDERINTLFSIKKRKTKSREQAGLHPISATVVQQVSKQLKLKSPTSEEISYPLYEDSDLFDLSDDIQDAFIHKEEPSGEDDDTLTVTEQLVFAEGKAKRTLTVVLTLLKQGKVVRTTRYSFEDRRNLSLKGHMSWLANYRNADQI